MAKNTAPPAAFEPGSTNQRAVRNPATDAAAGADTRGTAGAGPEPNTAGAQPSGTAADPNAGTASDQAGADATKQTPPTPRKRAPKPRTAARKRK